MDNQKQDGTDLLKSKGGAYTEMNKVLEDARSSAYVFSFIGALGILALILVWTGVIPLEMAFYMKCMFTVVMGGLFLFFIGIGFKSIRQLKMLRQKTNQEEKETAEMVQWMTQSFTLQQLDEMIHTDNFSMEQLYFARTELISSLIRQQFGQQEESYLDYVIEKIYEIYSPEDESVL